MITYNQILAIFREIADAHLQVRQFGAGPLADIPAEVDYALMWVMYDPAEVNITTRSDKITFQVLFADLLHEDKSNEHEILSDQKQTACDVVAQLQLEAYHADFEVEDLVKLEPIVEGITTDSIAGWMMTITLRVDYLSNACEVPSTLAPDERPGCPNVTIVDAQGNFLYTVEAGAVKAIADTVVKNSTGTTIAVGRAQSTINLPDKTLNNSDSSYTSPIVQGQDKSLADITILEGDGVNRTHPAGVNRTTSQRTFSISITLKAASALETAYQVAHQGTVKSVSLTNVSGYTVKRVRAGTITTVTLPFDVLQDDILHVSAVQSNSSVDSVLAFTAYHDVTSGGVTLPASNGDGRYLFVLNYVDQTVSVIDTNGHTVIGTTNLPSGFNYSSCLYRSANKTGWFFGNSSYAMMDCDPASATFRSILSSGFLAINSQQTGCAYDYINDMIYTGCANNAIFKLVPGTFALTNLGSYAGIIPARCNWLYFIEPLKAVFFGDAQTSQLIISTDSLVPIYGYGVVMTGQMQYNFQNGKIYQIGNGHMIVSSVNPLRQIKVIFNDNFGRSGIAIIPQYNKGYGANSSTNILGIVNTSSDTNITSVAKGSPATNETGTRQLAYSYYSNRVYAMGLSSNDQATGVNKIHIFDPSSDTYQGSITVGNLDTTNGHLFYGHQMFLNQLIY